VISGLKRHLFSLLAILCLAGCITVQIPVDDYNLARAALEAAREAEAARFSPGLWYKAEEAYRDAERRFRERSYRDAQRLFVEARFLAERAENAARIARFRAGENVP